MSSSATVARFASVDIERSGVGSRLQARRKSLGMPATRLAKEAQVSREHLSSVENGHHEPSPEWVRRVELALDRYATETGQADADPVADPKKPDAGFIRFTVEGVYGAKALVVEGPVENVAELEAAVDRILRRMQSDATD